MPGHQRSVDVISIPLLQRLSSHRDEIEFHALRGKVCGKLSQKFPNAAKMMKRRINQVHAQNSYGGLLRQVAAITQIDVQNNVVGRSMKFRLKAQPDPPVALIVARKVPRRHGINEAE